jgi:hypothetical protein
VNREIAKRTIELWDANQNKVDWIKGERALDLSSEEINHQSVGRPAFYGYRRIVEADAVEARKYLAECEPRTAHVAKRPSLQGLMKAQVHFAVKVLAQLDTDKALTTEHIMSIPLIREMQDGLVNNDDTFRRTINQALPDYAKKKGRPRDEDLPEVALKLPLRE